MKKNVKFYRNILLVILTSIHFSCKKFVTIDPPVNQVVSSSVFASDQAAISAMAGLYSQMMESSLYFTNGGLSVFASLSADEIYNTSPNVGYDPYRKNAIPTNESTTNFNRIWRRGYLFIYQANAIIEGIDRSTGLTLAVKNQLLGEAKFCRAFFYFHLTNIYGDVPLETSTDYRINAVMPRTASAEVYKQIKADLGEALNLLGPSYPSTGRFRPNKWTVASLLARVYLYQKDWANAETQSGSVIIQGIYSLNNTANIDQVFKAGSNETIWELMPVSASFNTAEGNTFVPSSATGVPQLALTNELRSAFEAGDQRSIAWTASNNVGGNTYYYPFKYKIKSTPIGGENNIVFRLAEQYLIRAEARAQQNNIAGAQSDLNVIRNRAGLTNTTANTQVTLLSAIEHERQIELFAEWGHRWLDLKRTQRADPVLGPVKGPNWQATDVLYPIPLSEMRTNVHLVQNPGY